MFAVGGGENARGFQKIPPLRLGVTDGCGDESRKREGLGIRLVWRV